MSKNYLKCFGQISYYLLKKIRKYYLNFFYKLLIKSKTLLSMFLVFLLFNLSYYKFFFSFIANINNYLFY